MSEAISRDVPTKTDRISYALIALTLIFAAVFHMAVPLLAALFGYLILSKLHLLERWGKWLPVLLFLLLVAGIMYGFGFFVRLTVRALPEIARQSVPAAIQWADHYHIELPFTDYDSFKDTIIETVKKQSDNLGNVAKFARGATTQIVLLVIGLIISIGLFLHPSIERGRANGRQNANLYSACCHALEQRFQTFYQSFATVMGAQIVISAMNTIFTAIFVVAAGLPYKLVVIIGTFLCGLLPIIGNLVSNTVIVLIGFTVSPQRALVALIFLVVIHKLEYFLNSKIVGDRIHNPFWLTLLALIIGEKLMGIPGMILAPVVLNYIKLELSKIEAPT